MTKKAFDYFDHDADIGIIGRGEKIEDAFIAAACAVFGIMTDLAAVQPSKKILIEFEESDPELALVTWLNLLIAHAIEHQMIFSEFRLKNMKSKWSGYAIGSEWRGGMSRGTEVKGATLTLLKVSQAEGQWEAQCVVDV